jgi:hypothetical protein
MKSLFALSAAALLAAGCASDPVVVAQKDCKVAPITTSSAVYTGKSKTAPDSLRQREAQMDLATSQYRFAQLQRNGLFNNNVEEALRDCDMAR